jgi:transposase
MEFQHIADYPPSEEDIEQLKAVARGYDSYRVRNRAHGILLLFRDGRSYEDVAKIFDVHRNTVCNWAERWASEGIDGLYDRLGRGAEPRFNEAEKDLIVECVEEEPRSVKAAAEKVENLTGKRASGETLRGILKRKGKSWKRERKTTKGEPTREEYEKGVADLAELARLSADGEFKLVFFDVAGFTLTPYVPYAWQDRGRGATLRIPTTGSPRVNELGFLNASTNEVTAFEHLGTVGSAVVIEVMEEYCDEMTEPAVVVVDNASVNTSEAVAKRAVEWERRGMSLYNLPRYSPELNPIEILWRMMKYKWIPSWAYTSIDALRDALGGILDSFGTKYRIQFSL